ncbi:MAG: S24 family peptidase [Anaerolineae bacterium]|nr:S24 family peptidase [Anaerolineae bacterium]
MWDLLNLALDNLEIESNITRALQEKIKKLEGNKELAAELSIQFDEEAQLNNCTQCPARSFRNFFLACVYYELGTIIQTQYYIKSAIKDFNRMGSKWNALLASWVYGETFMILNRTMPAQKVLENTVVMFEEMSRLSREKDLYEKRDECLNYIAKITKRINNPTGDWEGKEIVKKKDRPSFPLSAPSYSSPVRPEISKSYPWQRSQLIFPTQNQIRAGVEGDFIFESQPELDATIDELDFNEVAHHFYNLRETGNPIILNPRVYRWFRVEGDSMNQATPIPIMDNDYILAIDLNLSNFGFRFGDIIIAALDSPAQGERAGVIKRYASDGLVSESSNDYEVISLEETNIRGVAIAVAKPISLCSGPQKLDRWYSGYRRLT